MTHNRSRAAAAYAAGLALVALSGPLMAGPGNQGYAPTYGSGNNYAPQGGAKGGCATCGGHAAACTHPGPKVHCPPPYYHVYEGPPCLKFKKGCPRPVCDPCELPHFGYFQTCWSPWPYPPDWRHCPYPTASDLLPPPNVPPYTPKLNAERPPELQRDPRDSREPRKAPPKVEDPDEDGPEVPSPMRKPEQLPSPESEKAPVKDLSRNSRPSVRVLPE